MMQALFLTMFYCHVLTEHTVQSEQTYQEEVVHDGKGDKVLR